MRPPTFSYLRLSLSLKLFSFNFSILNRFPNLFCFSVLSKRETSFKLEETRGAEVARDPEAGKGRAAEPGPQLRRRIKVLTASCAWQTRQDKHQQSKR